jgi:hypothetical protein
MNLRAIWRRWFGPAPVHLPGVDRSVFGCHFCKTLSEPDQFRYARITFWGTNPNAPPAMLLTAQKACPSCVDRLRWIDVAPGNAVSEAAALFPALRGCVIDLRRTELQWRKA